MRLDIDTYREISQSLRRNRSRSLLTGFGIFWGIFMLLFLLGGGRGLRTMLNSNFEGFATNCTVIFANSTSRPYDGLPRGRKWDFTISDVDYLRRMMPELETVTPIIGQWGQTAKYQANSVSCYVKGAYPDYTEIEQPQIRYGRYLNNTDVSQQRKVCVIGKRIYTSLFGEGVDPCGEMIQVGAVWYKVVGVDFNSGNISVGGRSDEAVVVPLPVVQKIYRCGDKVEMIGMTAYSSIRTSSLEKRLRQVVAHRHRFDSQDRQALFVLNTDEMFSLMDNLFKGVNFLIWLVGLGTILAGAIGVSNIMMVTVRERTTEIGIRRAIGATPVDILMQIIMESVALTMISGCLGIVFSVGLLSLLETAFANEIFQISFWAAVGAVGLLTLMGVVSGLAPALRAMKIRPVDAMRDM